MEVVSMRASNSRSFALPLCVAALQLYAKQSIFNVRTPRRFSDLFDAAVFDTILAKVTQSIPPSLRNVTITLNVPPGPIDQPAFDLFVAIGTKRWIFQQLQFLCPFFRDSVPVTWCMTASLLWIATQNSALTLPAHTSNRISAILAGVLAQTSPAVHHATVRMPLKPLNRTNKIMNILLNMDADVCNL